MSVLKREVEWKALIGPGVALLSFILSPDFLSTLPDKYSHIGMGIGALLSVFFPQLLKKKNVNSIDTSVTTQDSSATP
jgi:hypothetical protein